MLTANGQISGNGDIGVKLDLPMQQVDAFPAGYQLSNGTYESIPANPMITR
jgi:hypothetical protein